MTLKLKVIKIIRFSNEAFITISNILTYFLLIPYILTLIWINIQKTYNVTAKATIEKKILKKWIIPYTLLITLFFIFSAFPSSVSVIPRTEPFEGISSIPWSCKKAVIKPP